MGKLLQQRANYRLASVFFPDDPNYPKAPAKKIEIKKLAGKDPSKGRKSKVQALSKITAANAENAGRAAPGSFDDPLSPVKPEPLKQEYPAPKANPARKAIANRQYAPSLDLSSICTLAPRDMPQRTQDRPFGLEHCPVYFPTIEEFAKPMEYIEKVSREASEEHGIAKIVPPAGWVPPFALNSEASLSLYPTPLKFDSMAFRHSASRHVYSA